MLTGVDRVLCTDTSAWRRFAFTTRVCAATFNPWNGLLHFTFSSHCLGPSLLSFKALVSVARTISFGVEGDALTIAASSRSSSFVEAGGAEAGDAVFCVGCETDVDGAPVSGAVLGKGATCSDAGAFTAVFSSR